MSKAPTSTSELILQVTDLARGGAGVARDESGRVIFVPFTAPGDRVRVRILPGRKEQYAQAELLEVVESSPLRVKPRCPAFGRCGGCQWQHLPYELQWQTKAKGVRHALKRVQIDLDAAGVKLEELPAERIWEYRNRVQLRGEGRELGFFEPGSRTRVAVDRCDIARPELNAAWEETRAEAPGVGQPGPAVSFKVELEVLEDGTVRKHWNSGHAAGGFRQVHDEQNEKLRAWVASVVTPGRPILDLFGGAGNLSLGLVGRSPEIHCVDTTAPRGREGPGGIRFHRSPVLDWLLRTAGANPAPRPWNIIVDPPREGLGRDLAEIAACLERLGACELAAVGCDPDSWARDLAGLLRRGWRLERAASLDLFPQTPHVESLALLRR